MFKSMDNEIDKCVPGPMVESGPLCVQRNVPAAAAGRRSVAGLCFPAHGALELGQLG